LANQPGWGVAHSAFGFLKEVGVVPENVMTIRFEKVRLGVDRESVPAGYLASAAYEWDTWGPSHPSDFIDAIDEELNPRRREFVAALLTSLGRSVQED
jgi:hypothetical protein